MEINLLPLYSRLADSTAQSGVSWHQQATWEALADPTIDAVINTALTGDGKSYAAFGAYPDGGVMAMYPTNELVRDQQRQLETYRSESGFRGQRLTGWDLEQWARAAKSSKAETLLDLADSEVLLTNPDLFYYLHQGNYLKDFLRQGKGDRLDLWRQIDQNFKALIFDEFHLYQPSQVSGVLNTLLLMRSVEINHKYIFLSATPNPVLIKALKLAGLNTRVISPSANDAYQTVGGIGWRQISHPISLHIEPTQSGRGESWILDRTPEILQFFLDHPGSKGAIILNSIASVKRVRKALSVLFKAHKLKVTENTGFTSGEAAEKAVTTGDLVVGTSTLDVGIDFRINYLIFEGHDAPSFMQRLGRLGRHSGFEVYQAHAIVPTYFWERLRLHFQNQEESEIDRVTLAELVQNQHREVNSFAQYYKRWSPVQALATVQQLGHPDLDGAYLANATQCKEAYEALYGQSFQDVMQQCRNWKSESDSLRVSNAIVAEARSFRGTSSLQCAVLDGAAVKSYHLPGILSNYEYQVLDKAEFIRRSGRKAAHLPSFVDHVRFHIQIGEMLEKRRYWSFYLEERHAQKQAGKLHQWCGIETDGDESGNQISRVLAKTVIPTFIVPMCADDVRRSLKLPLHFPIYDLKTRPFDRYHIYSVAFDQAALMLDAYLGQGDALDRDMIAHHSKQVFQQELEDDDAFLKQFQWLRSGLEVEAWKTPSGL